MIKEVTVYTVVCDGCGEDYCHGTEYCGFPAEEDAINYALDEGWTAEDDKHYCPDCWRPIQEEHEEECKQTALEEEHNFKQATK